MIKIVEQDGDGTGPRHIHDGYKEKMKALITSKMKGEIAQAEDMRPKKPAAKSMMEALRETVG